MQLSQQTIPQLERHRDKFENYHKVDTPRYEVTTPTGGKIISFVTREAGRAEGWHKEDDIDGPLLMIVNEAKTVNDGIFEALDRCTWNALILLSSPGLKVGRFWKCFSDYAAQWIKVTAGLKDCPHIPKERIDYIRATYGENHPVTRSTLYGEFMDQEEVEKYIFNQVALENLVTSPPPFVPGVQIVACDFADGGAENVIFFRDGNKYELIDAWRETNKNAAVARFIGHFLRLQKRWRGAPEDFETAIWGDAADKEMLDLLKDAGWGRIRRQNMGGPPNDPVYVSWGAEAWRETSTDVEKREIIIPKDDVLMSQLTTRLKDFGRAGKLGVEEKYQMRKRGLKSPDRGDALCMARNARDWSQTVGRRLNRASKALDSQMSSDSQFLEGIGANAGWG